MLLLIFFVPAALAFSSDSSNSTGVSATSQGNQYYVSTIGSDGNPGTLEQPWRTILKAVNSMYPGDTTFVREGTYDKFLPIGWNAGSGYDGSQAKSGTPTAPITLRTYPNERAVLRQDEFWTLPNRNRHKMIDIRQRSNWVIEGFVFDQIVPPDGYRWWSYGIYVVGPAKGVVIRNNTFEGNGITRPGGVIIDVIYDVQDSLIESNRFQNWPSSSDLIGIALETQWRNAESDAIPNKNTIIRGNVFEGIGGDGVQIGPWGGYNTLIEKNTFRARYNDENNGTPENAIDIKRSFFTTIRGNVMSGYRPKWTNPRGDAIIVHLMAQDVLIEENTIFDNGCGITVVAGDPDSALPTPTWYTGSKLVERITIRRNTIVDSNIKAAFDGRAGVGKGIDAAGVDGLKIYHNVIAFAEATALALETVSGVEIRNNIFYRSYNGVIEDTRAGPGPSQIIIGANLFDVDGRQIVLRGENGILVADDLETFKVTTGQAVGSYTMNSVADAIFVNPHRSVSIADYRLRRGSPAIDTGDFISDHNDRYLGSAPDMGAKEYDPASEKVPDDRVSLPDEAVRH